MNRLTSSLMLRSVARSTAATARSAASIVALSASSSLITSFPISANLLATSRRFCSSTSNTVGPSSLGTSDLAPAPIVANADGKYPHYSQTLNDKAHMEQQMQEANTVSSAKGLSESDQEILRQAFVTEARVHAARQEKDAAIAAQAAAEGREEWEIRKEIAESGKLLVDKERKSQMGGEGIGTKQGDMMAIFTCNVCEHRSAKRFSKHCYTQGIVIVQCPGCTSRHLLADNMGWFQDESKNIEDILRERGEDVVKLDSGVFIETVAPISMQGTSVVDDKNGKSAA